MCFVCFVYFLLFIWFINLTFPINNNNRLSNVFMWWHLWIATLKNVCVWANNCAKISLRLKKKRTNWTKSNKRKRFVTCSVIVKRVSVKKEKETEKKTIKIYSMNHASISSNQLNWLEFMVYHLAMVQSIEAMKFCKFMDDTHAICQCMKQ